MRFEIADWLRSIGHGDRCTRCVAVGGGVVVVVVDLNN